MATKEDIVEETDIKSVNSQNGKDSADSSSCTYFHNPEEFIDIHGSHPQQVASGTRKDANNSMTVPDDQSPPQKTVTGDVNFVPSETTCNAVPSLKVPVQVSEESDAKENIGQYKHYDSSDEEYQSADEGEEENDQDCKTTEKEEEFEEEEESDEDFIPTGEEENCPPDEDGKPDEEEDGSNTAGHDSDNGDEEKKEQEIIDDLEIRRKEEEFLTEEEKQERKAKGQALKDDGNVKFRAGDFDAAITSYTEALDICPLNFVKERSIMFSNRAACKMKMEFYNEAIKDCSSALDLHPHYLKALLRRAELYEKTEKLDEALKDYQQALELDPSLHSARAACVKLADQIKERNEKMKEEMMGKLKDLGNMVLRPFGLSVNNFKLQQDPDTGSYSVQFQQNQPKNGS